MALVAIAVVTTIGGVVLGRSLDLLLTSVTEAHVEGTQFESEFNNLKSALASCRRWNQYIERVGRNDPNHPVMHDLNALVLVQKCSRIHPLRLKMGCIKNGYVGKLGELCHTLQRLCFEMKVIVSMMSMENKLQALNNQRLQTMLAQQTENLASCSVPDPPPFTVGLEEHLEKLREKILHDGQVSMYALVAPGGYGKTTLAQKFCQDNKVQERFKENICFITVSENPNLDNIVEQLCQKTRSSALQDKGADALKRLEQVITETGEQNPLLLVLDDVFLVSSDSLLDKCDELRSPTCKILVTSRIKLRVFRDSCTLKPLKDEDALSLFRNTTSVEDNGFHIPEALVEEIVELCAGIPFAINFIGKQLRNQPEEIWRRLATRSTRGSSMHDILKSSLDALCEEEPLALECFMDLGSFPEDRRIPAAALIDMWAELHGLDMDSSSIAYLYDLTSHCLANLTVIRNAEDTNGYYSEHFVTQHDIFRNLAIEQSSHDSIGDSARVNIDIREDKVPEWWTQHRSRPTMTLLLSISTDKDFSSKWRNMNLPEAKVLVLNLQSKNYAFPKFKKNMSKSLKVLIVTNYGALPAEVINFTSLSSLSHLKRIRLHRISIPPITKKHMKLKILQKMSLFMCSMGQAKGPFKFFETFPSLEEINIDYCSDLKELPADICSLIHLKKLSITNCHKLSTLPEEIGELVNLELLRLRSCTNLSEFPDSIRKLTKLKAFDISHCFSIKELPEHIGEMGCLVTLNMRDCSRLTELPESILDLGRLTDVICDPHTIGLWEPYKPILRKTIKIREVKEIYSLDWLHQ